MATLVAINGLGGLAYLWERFAAALPEETGLRVLDLPGHGDRPIAMDYGYDALVDDALARTADLPPFALLGWSVGAAVAWLLAARHPGRVTHLVLIEPAAPHQSPFRYGALPDPVHPITFASAAKAADALRGIDPTTTDEEIPRSHRQNLDGRWEPRFDPAIFPAIVADARDRGEELYFELERISIPTLILRGERSFITPAQVDELAKILPNARTQTVPGGGHFLVRERPAATANAVLAFLAS